MEKHEQAKAEYAQLYKDEIFPILKRFEGRTYEDALSILDACRSQLSTYYEMETRKMTIESSRIEVPATPLSSQ